MKRLICLASVVLLVLALARAVPALDLAAKVESACGACHSVGRVCGKLGGDQDYWQKTVNRMVDNGANLARPEVGPVAAYLAGLELAKAPFCK